MSEKIAWLCQHLYHITMCYFASAKLAIHQFPGTCLDIGKDMVQMGTLLLAAATFTIVPPPTLFTLMMPTTPLLPLTFW